jgi:hypothetical protein
MPTGPKSAVSGPNRAAPDKPDHRGQLARLIRERPVFVNVAGGLPRGSFKPCELPEYINVCGVFWE